MLHHNYKTIFVVTQYHYSEVSYQQACFLSKYITASKCQSGTNVCTSQSGGEIRVCALDGQTDSLIQATKDLGSKLLKPKGNHSVLHLRVCVLQL